jgi:hypothetical protein
MQEQHRINKIADSGAESYWRRCKRVAFEDGIANWELEQKRYSLFQAYEQGPHRQFISASDDDSLLSFLKAWGPLSPSVAVTGPKFVTEEKVSGSVPIAVYRHEQRKLEWIVRLFAAIEDSDTKKQRVALSEFSDLRREASKIAKTFSDIALTFRSWGVPRIDPWRILGAEHAGNSYPPQVGAPALVVGGRLENIQRWAQTANGSSIEAVCIELGRCMKPSSSLEYTVVRHEGRNVVRAVSAVKSLGQALHWMVWQDVFQMNPLRFCAECPKLIVNESRHAKKFCSTECAKRKTVREWQRRNRAKGKGESNGTQEAR